MRYFIANWKLNMTTGKAESFVSSFVKRYVPKKRSDRVVICPSFTTLPAVAARLKKHKHIVTGSQDVFWKTSGNYTGEVSPEALKQLGVAYAIIGHSERRQIANETDAMINKKLLALLASGIIPILCIGETAAERRKKQTRVVLSRELKKGLAGVKRGKELLVAYEPLWAISKHGKGSSMDPETLKKEVASIQAILVKIGANRKFGKIHILYGGSVSPASITDILSVPGIRGVLVGNASLSPVSFSKLAMAC